MRNAYRILVRKPKGKNSLGRPSIDEKISRVILEKRGVRIWTGFIWLRLGSINGFL
jgi:hypothetical protein